MHLSRLHFACVHGPGRDRKVVPHPTGILEQRGLKRRELRNVARYALAGDARRHRRLLDIRRLAHRALDQTRLALLLIIRARAEPSLEGLATVATLKVKDDHRLTAAGMGLRWVSAGYARSNIRNPLEIDVTKTDAPLLAHVEEDLAPRIDGKAVSECVATVLMVPDLGRGDHEQPGFNGARPQENVPVRLARWDGEGGRNGNEVGVRFGEAREKAGKRRS